jgi:hypothetical protein
MPGYEAWAVSLPCRACEHWSAWEGLCFREADDALPSGCPHEDDDEDEGEEPVDVEVDDWY